MTRKLAGSLSGRNRLKFLREFGKSAGFLGKASILTFLFFALLFNASLSGVSMYSRTTNSDWQTGTFANTTADSGDLRLNWTRAYDNWLYRRPISISGSGSPLTDYQVSVTPYIYNETGLVGSWHFSESGGRTTADSSGYGNNGLLVNGANHTEDGKFGNAMKFDGTNDYVNVGTIGANADWTVGFWARPNSVASAIQYPIGLDSSPAGIYMAYDSEGDRWGFYSGTTTFSGTTVIQPNIWYFISVVKSGTTYTLYMNGTYETSSTLADIDITNLNIGRRSEGFWYFNGIIDEVRIYNRALSASEIQQQYQAKARLDYADIRFTDSDGTTPLPFWMESDGKFWVKVPSIPTGGTTIYAYYGNPFATDSQNATGTFEQFYAGGTVTNGNDLFPDSTKQFSTNNHAIRTKVKINNTAGQNARYAIMSSSSTTSYTDPYIAIAKDVSIQPAIRSAGAIGSSFTNSNDLNYHIWELYGTTSTFYGKRDDIETVSIASGIPTNFYLAYRVDNVGTSQKLTIDWGLVRKYASPEPSAVNGTDEARPTWGSYLSNTISLGQTATSITAIWNDTVNWRYRLPINLTNPGTALTDYQVNVSLDSIYNSSGLVGSWHFSESSGNATADSSGQGNTGYQYGSNRTTDGKFGNAMKFDGVDDYVKATSSFGDVNFLNQAFTAEFWMKFANSGTYGVISSIKPATSTNFGIQIAKIGADKIALVFSRADGDTGSRQWAGYDTAVSTNTWYHVVFSHDGSGSSAGTKIYINGSLVTAATSNFGSSGWGGDNNKVRLGGSSESSEFFNGAIDEVRIYNRALSASEIQSHYQASKARLDYADLRFTDSAGAPLPFWLETDGKAWVKVPSVPAGSSTIYAYYGNPFATDAQNATGTFEFFDDFSGDLSKWTGDTAHASMSSGILTYDTTAVGSWATLKSTATFSRPSIVRTKTKLTGTGVVYDRVGFTDGTTGIGVYVNSIEFTYHNGKYIMNSISDTDNTSPPSTYTTDAYVTYEIKWTPSGNSFYADDREVTGSPVAASNPTADTKVGYNNYNTIINSDWILVRKYAATEPFTANLTETTGPYKIGTVWDPNVTIEVSANGGTTWHVATNNTALSVAGDPGTLTNLVFRANLFSKKSWLPRLSDIALFVESSETPTPTPIPTPTPPPGQPPSVLLSGSPPNLTCSSASYTGTTLQNITLYTNFTGSWSAEQLVNISGTSNSTTFQKQAPIASGNYSWNCLAFDSSGLSTFAVPNATITVARVQAPTAGQVGMAMELTGQPSVVSGNVVSFTARIISNATEPIVGIIPAISILDQSKVANLTIVPSVIPLLPANGSANFTVSFTYLAVGRISISFLASGVGQQSGLATSSNAVESELYFGVQFALSLSTGKVEVLPNAGSSISILAKNTAAFTREKVRLKLSDTSCCSFSLTPNGIDLPSGSGAAFTLTLSPVSTAQPGTTYTTNIVAYTDAEPALASADLTVSILKDIVPETGAARERALSAIRNANDTILFVDVRIAEAERQKLDTYKAATALAGARKLYKEALALMDSSDYDGAYLKATDASTKAQSALTLIPIAPSPAPGVAMTTETADASIKTAEATILFVDKQVAEAERQKLDTYKAATALAEARGLIKQAKAARESGDYSGAADLAAQATALATSALKSVPKPGQLRQIPVAKLAIAGIAMLLVAAVVYLRFIRKSPPRPKLAYYPQPQYYGYRPAQ